MIRTKHNEWRVFRDMNGILKVISARTINPKKPDTVNVIAVISDKEKSQKEQYYNAQLVALAPSLYKLLADLKDDLQEQTLSGKPQKLGCNSLLYLRLTALLKMVKNYE